MSVTGPGASKFILSGADQHRPFLIKTGKVVSISGITVAHGACDGSPCGIGAGLLNRGTLTLTSVVVRANAATITGGTSASPQGGGI